MPLLTLSHLSIRWMSRLLGGIDGIGDQEALLQTFYIIEDALGFLAVGGNARFWWYAIVSGDRTEGLYITLDEMLGDHHYVLAFSDAPAQFLRQDCPEATQTIYSYRNHHHGHFDLELLD